MGESAVVRSSTGSLDLGWSDVALVERAELTSGSTFHSAGLVGQLRNSLSLTQMMMNSVELYRTLGEEVGPRDRVARGRIAATRVLAKSTWKSSNARPRWAETFGLPLAPHLGRRGAVDVSADVDRRRARRGAACRRTATSIRAS